MAESQTKSKSTQVLAISAEMLCTDDEDAQSCNSASSSLHTSPDRIVARGGSVFGAGTQHSNHNPFGSLNTTKDNCKAPAKKKCCEEIRLIAEGPFATTSDTQIIFCWHFCIINDSNQNLCDTDFSFAIRSYQTNEPFTLGPGIFASDPGPSYSVSTTLASGKFVDTYNGTGVFYENAVVQPGSFSLTLCAAFSKDEYEEALLDKTRLLTSIFSAKAQIRTKCGSKIINVSQCVEPCTRIGHLPVFLSKVGSDLYYNEETMLFEACYTITVQNLTGLVQSGVTIRDNVRAQYVAAGVQDAATDLSIQYVQVDPDFVNPDFVGVGSSQTDILVENRSLAPDELQTIVYIVRFPRICIDLPLGVKIVENVAQMRHICHFGKNEKLVCVRTAIEKTNVSTAEYRGRLDFSKRFCAPLLDATNKRVDLPVLLDIGNVGNTPVVLDSLIDAVAAQLGSTAFSIVNRSSSILCAGRGGTSTAPPVNNAFNGNSVTEVLGSVVGGYKVGPGQAVQIAFTIRLEHAALLHLNTLTNATFVNTATLTWHDVVCRTATCISADKFRCGEIPRLMVVQTVEYLRYRKSRINVYEGVPYSEDLTQFQIAYEASLQIEITNTGNAPVCDVDARLQLEETLNGGVVWYAEVVNVQTFPVGAPALTGRPQYTGKGTGLSTTRLIQPFDLQPNQGVVFYVHFAYVPPNNSLPGVINVPPPTCSTPLSDQSPAISGFGSLNVQYGATCSDPPAIAIQTPIVSRECPRVLLEKETVRMMDLSDAFTQTTDVNFRKESTNPAGSNIPNVLLPSTSNPAEFLPTPPPPQYNCYQTTFKYKVTNSGDVPLDQFLICDTFFDQLVAQDSAAGPLDGFCVNYVVKPPVLVSGSPDEGSVTGNSGWTGTTSGNPVLAQGSGMLLPGNSIEFRVIIRFCYNPKTTIRFKNDASVRARTPNEGLVIGTSRAILPVVGPSLCVTKQWDTGYPIEKDRQNEPGIFIGKLCYIVYNDGDRRVLDVKISDKFTEDVYEVTDSRFPDDAPIENSVRRIVSPTCTTAEGESNYDPSWTGTDVNLIVNTPLLPYLDRSESYTMCTTPFLFRVDGLTANTLNVVNVTGMTIYDNPANNDDAVLTDLVAYQGYVGPGSDLAFGELCATASLTTGLGNFIDDCPRGPQPNPLQSVATVLSSEPGCTIYELEFQFTITNTNNGSIVGVACIDTVTVTDTTASFGPGVTSQGPVYDVVDPSPIMPGGTGIVTWKQQIKWAGSYPTTPPSLNVLSYQIDVDNDFSLNPDSCNVFFEPQTLPVWVLGNFIHNCPAPGTLLTPISAVATFDGGSSGDWRYTMEYAFTFDNLDDMGGTGHVVAVTSVSVSPSSPGAPFQSLGVTITNNPTPVAPGASGLVQWTEEIRYTGAEDPPTPPAFPDPTFTLEVDNTVGADSDSCALTYTAPTFPPELEV